MTEADRQALRPRMLEVNTLVEEIRKEANARLEGSLQTLRGVHSLLRERLGLSYQLQILVLVLVTIELYWNG